MEEMAYIDSACNKKWSLYMHQTVPIISSKWYVKLCLVTVGIWQLRMSFYQTVRFMSRTIDQVILTSIM